MRSVFSRLRSQRWAASAAFALLALLPACGRRAPNVLLVSVDSLRADHLGAYGYERDTSPGFDRLAREGALFTRAVSSTSWTLPAHAALFTALPDSSHGTNADRPLDEDFVTLAETLRDAGYRTVGFYGGPFLHPAFGLAQGFEEWVDCTSYRMSERSGESPARFDSASHRDVTNPAVLREVERRLDAEANSPFFFFVHLWDVHYDYLPPPPYDTLFDPDYAGDASGRRFMQRFGADLPERDRRHVVAVYDGEIRYTDDTLAAILELLEDRGLLRDTLVVVTADHGEEFLDHGDRGHRHTLYEELLHVPLVFWQPRRIAPQRVDEVVRFVDVAPTILDAAGLPPLPAAAGESLLPLLEGRRSDATRPRPALSELRGVPRSPDLTSLRVGDHKLILNEETGRAEYYDLAADPGEERSVAAEERAEGRRLLALLASLRESAAPAPDAGARPDLDPRTEAQLRALGYLD